MNLHLQTSKQLGICGVEYMILLVLFVAVLITQYDDIQNLFNDISALVETDLGVLIDHMGDEKATVS